MTPRAEHRHVAGWGGAPGECGVECACGVGYDGFDTIAEAAECLDRHIAEAARPRPFTPAERRIVAAATYTIAVGVTLAALAIAGMAGVDLLTWTLVCAACIWAWTSILRPRRKR